MDRCFTNATADACAKAKGWPASPRTTDGIGSPEGSVVGYWPGDSYVATDNGNYWLFNGTPGENTGWELINL